MGNPLRGKGFYRSVPMYDIYHERTKKERML